MKEDPVTIAPKSIDLNDQDVLGDINVCLSNGDVRSNDNALLMQF